MATDQAQRTRGLKSDRVVKRELARLARTYGRECGSADPIEKRVAYAIAHAIVWARQKTVGWPLPSDEPKEYAQLIRDDLKRIAESSR